VVRDRLDHLTLSKVVQGQVVIHSDPTVGRYVLESCGSKQLKHSTTMSRTSIHVHVSVYTQVYLLTPMDRATLSHAKSPIEHCTQVKSPGSKRRERHLKHIATRKTVTCRLLAQTYTVNINSLISSHNSRPW